MTRKATRKVVRMRQLRREREWTQQQLAAKVRVAASAICLYERGDRTPSLHVALRIGAALECPVEQLLELVEVPA